MNAHKYSATFFQQKPSRNAHFNLNPNNNNNNPRLVHQIKDATPRL